MLNKEEILKLKPTFKSEGGMEVVDWYKFYGNEYWCMIESGLKCAAGIGNSPYKFSISVVTTNPEEVAIAAFNKFWDKIKNKQ